MVKSCLKNSPPLSRESSEPSSPSGSWCSPQMRPQPLKSVSFCSDEELEEVFFVDEWDRTPLPVAPRLTYQDMLELKQLRLTPPSPSCYRQPFSTSAPSAGEFPFPSTNAASQSSPYPVSKWASQPSHTPSKWKNRGQTHLDPEILPYLEAVPIRLLPLLDTSRAESPEPAFEEAQLEPTPPQREPAVPAPVEPPNPPSLPEPPVSAPPPHPVSPPAVSPPRTPPAIQIPPLQPIEPPSTPTPSRPIEDSPTTPTSLLPPRKLGFTFVPLLPVEPAPVVVQEEPAPAPTPKPKRTFNMTFIPLAAAAEPPFVPEAPSQPAAAPLFSPRALQLTLLTDSAAPTPSLSPSSPSPSHDPSDTTDAASSDLDTDLDTDAESDAPSTSTASSIPASPPEHPAAVPFPALAHDGYFAYSLHAAHEDKRSPGGGPGLTPPLAALYPSPRGAPPAWARGVPGTALAPPSPFALGAPAVMSKRLWARKLADPVDDAASESTETGSVCLSVDGEEGVIPPSIGRRRRESVVA